MFGEEYEEIDEFESGSDDKQLEFDERMELNDRKIGDKTFKNEMYVAGAINSIYAEMPCDEYEREGQYSLFISDPSYGRSGRPISPLPGQGRSSPPLQTASPPDPDLQVYYHVCTM